MAVVSFTQNLQFIEKVFGSAGVAHNFLNVEVRCPICNPPKTKIKRKLVIRVADHFCHCWVCGFRARSLAPLITKYARTYLNEYKTTFAPDLKQIQHIEEQVKLVELPTNFKLLTTSSERDPDVLLAKRYVLRRGLTEKEMWYYKLGVSSDSKWSRRIIVPSFDSAGKLNYFVARAIDANRKPKYENPDVNKTSIIFNEINVDWKKRLVLCEGVFDMFKCGSNVVPILGSDLNEESLLFNSILINSTPISLALDGDMYYTKTQKIAKKMQEYDIDVEIVDTRRFADPGSVTSEEFNTVLQESQKFDWSLMFNTKLNHASKFSLRV